MLHLCFPCNQGTLATSAGGDPHLSLMNFTFAEDAELGTIIILSTKRATKKFSALVSNPKVAVLVHDFDTLRSSGSDAGSEGGVSERGDHYARGTSSVTVYGGVTVAVGDVQERCRALHLLANPKYPQFILGRCSVT